MSYAISPVNKYLNVSACEDGNVVRRNNFWNPMCSRNSSKLFDGYCLGSFGLQKVDVWPIVMSISDKGEHLSHERASEIDVYSSP